jgi:hypothetical protein
MNTGTIIRDQIRAMDRCALMAWGAKDMTAIENGLRFKSSGMVKKKGWVSITLNSMDLYDVEFGQAYKHEYKVRKNSENVFVEDLIEIIDGMVG